MLKGFKSELSHRFPHTYYIPIECLFEILIIQCNFFDFAVLVTYSFWKKVATTKHFQNLKICNTKLIIVRYILIFYDKHDTLHGEI